MTDLKPCVRCERPIDRYAKSCVYCNWDQAEAAPPPTQASAPPPYVPPVDKRARNRLVGIVAVASLIVLAFIIGTVIHGFEPSEVKASPSSKPAARTTTGPLKPSPKSDVTLVPATDTDANLELDQPLTTTPPQAPGQEPNDATALPADQYAALAARARAQRQAASAPVDPRTVRGSAYDEPPPPPHKNSGGNAENAGALSSTGRTEAYPVYKPLPDIRVDRDTTARLILTVGADGRVKDIDITDSLPGSTAQLVGAVQRWRFRPATESGIPVPAKVAVTITLHGNE